MRKLSILLALLLMLLLPALAEETRLIDGVTFSGDGTVLIEYPADKTDAHYTVPSGVKEIADGAFFQNGHVTRVTLPDTVTVIGPAAFQYCESLRQIDMPERLSGLGQGAFAGTGLTTLRIPAGVRDLPAELLVDVPCLTDVYLSHSVKTVGSKSPEEGADFSLVSDDPAVVLHAPPYSEAEKLVRASGHPYMIEDWYTPTCTLDMAAECLAELHPDYEDTALCTDAHGRPMFTYGEENAFALISNGANMYLASFVNWKYGWGWYFCADMEGLTPISMYLVDDTLTLFLGWGEKAVSITAVNDCNGWGDWYVTAMETLAPQGDGWTPESQTVYGTPIPLHSYSPVNGEQEPVVIEGNTLIRYPESRMDAHYTVPDGVEVIAPNAFEGNHVLTRVTLPDSVRVIGDEAFAYCSGLRVVDMPATLESLGESAFDCTYVQHLTIPEGLTELPKWAFCAADLQGTVIIPEGITNIGDECFAFNADITDMYLPASLETMGGESVDDGRGFDFIYAFNHLDIGQEHMTVHAPAGTEAAKFAIRSGYPYVIEDARGGTDLPAMTALVQLVLDEQLPGAAVCENVYGFPCVSYGAETVFAFAMREGSGWYDECFLCCFDRSGDELTLRFVNDALYGDEWPQFWPERMIPLDMALIDGHFNLMLQVGDRTVIGLTFSGEDWRLTHTSTAVWYEPGDGSPNGWQTQLRLPVTDGAPLAEFSTVHYESGE